MKGENKVTQPDNWLTDWNGTFVKGGYFVNVEDWQEVTNDWYEIWNMDFSKDIDLSDWNPTDKGTTFLQNFREHIALRLTANGSGKTLTLSQAVRDAIHAAEATYGIEAIIVTQKGWTLSPAPGASSQ